MISIDQSRSKWTKYVSKTNPNAYGYELFIDDQFSSDFSRGYGINSIPRYILIDKNGSIINANMMEPSENLEPQILELTNAN